MGLVGLSGGLTLRVTLTSTSPTLAELNNTNLISERYYGWNCASNLNPLGSPSRLFSRRYSAYQ